MLVDGDILSRLQCHPIHQDARLIDFPRQVPAQNGLEALERRGLSPGDERRQRGSPPLGLIKREQRPAHRVDG